MGRRAEKSRRGCYPESKPKPRREYQCSLMDDNNGGDMTAYTKERRQPATLRLISHSSFGNKTSGYSRKWLAPLR